MDKVACLLSLQKRAFESSPWHSVKSALSGIADDVFFRVPASHNGFPWMEGSIADIVYHVAGDKLVQLSHAFGDSSITWKSLALRKGDKLEMLQDLEEANEKMTEALSSQTNESLRERVPTWGDTRMTAEDLFLMLIEHDLYHAGQIRYIRNVAENG